MDAIVGDNLMKFSIETMRNNFEKLFPMNKSATQYNRKTNRYESTGHYPYLHTELQQARWEVWQACNKENNKSDNHYEKLKELFTEFGLGFEELSGHAVSGAISDLDDSNGGNKAISCTMGEHLKVGGYTGFSSEFVFDKDGNFIQLNCWE